MILDRKFHPVGQGLFCTERFKVSEDDEINIIYDCGTLNSQALIDEAIKNEFGPQAVEKKVDIDFMFISHFHADHISGLDTLLKYCNIKKYVIPVLSTERIVEAYIFNIIHGSAANRNLINIVELSSDQVLVIDENSEINIHPSNLNDWLFLPYQPTGVISHQLEEKMKKAGFSILWDAFNKKDFEQVDSLIEQIQSNKQFEKLKDVYNKSYGGHHSYMMTLYSGYLIPQRDLDERNALYCGDYEAKDSQSVNNLTTPLRRKWPKIGTLQVPHHGSKNNNCQDLYDFERHCIISYGNSNFKHPHIETIQYILNVQKDKALKTLHLVYSNPISIYKQHLNI